jgi:hypothetical protein
MPRMGTDLAGEGEGVSPLGETASDHDGLVALGVDGLRGKTLAVALGQFGVDDVPLSLEHAPEDGISGLLGRRFQLIESPLGKQGGEIGAQKVEGGELGDLVSIRLIDAAEQHTNMADEALLGHYRVLC